MSELSLLVHLVYKMQRKCAVYSYAAYTMGHKNVTLYFCPYLRQLLIDFQNSFTGALCRQFAIM